MTDYEIYLVSGFLLGCLGVISMFSALVDGRRPFFSIVMLIIAGGAIFMAKRTANGDIAFIDIPNAIIAVVARLLN